MLVDHFCHDHFSECVELSVSYIQVRGVPHFPNWSLSCGQYVSFFYASLYIDIHRVPRGRRRSKLIPPRVAPTFARSRILSVVLGDPVTRWTASKWEVEGLPAPRDGRAINSDLPLKSWPINCTPFVRNIPPFPRALGSTLFCRLRLYYNFSNIM